MFLGGVVWVGIRFFFFWRENFFWRATACKKKKKVLATTHAKKTTKKNGWPRERTQGADPKRGPRRQDPGSPNPEKARTIKKSGPEGWEGPRVGWPEGWGARWEGPSAHPPPYFFACPFRALCSFRVHFGPFFLLACLFACLLLKHSQVFCRNGAWGSSLCPLLKHFQAWFRPGLLPCLLAFLILLSPLSSPFSSKTLLSLCSKTHFWVLGPFWSFCEKKCRKREKRARNGHLGPKRPFFNGTRGAVGKGRRVGARRVEASEGWGPKGWGAPHPVGMGAPVHRCAGALWFHKMPLGSPSAHFGWATAWNRGHNSTRRPPRERRKNEICGGIVEKRKDFRAEHTRECFLLINSQHHLTDLCHDMARSTVFSDHSHRGACSWESALFKGPDDFNGCGYFHVSLLLFASRHICRWFEEDLGSEFV